MNYDTLQYIEYKDDKSQDTDIWPNLRLIYSSGLDWTYFWLINCSILVQAILSPVSSLKATHPWKNGVFRVSVRRGSFLSLKKLISEQKISKGTQNKALHLFFWLFLIAEKKILSLLALSIQIAMGQFKNCGAFARIRFLFNLHWQPIFLKVYQCQLHENCWAERHCFQVVI